MHSEMDELYIFERSDDFYALLLRVAVALATSAGEQANKVYTIYCGNLKTLPKHSTRTR
jgi:hypothetical protein